jgi:cellulose synthase/poly-beta-1,6-N-acetylglucosamine synthase-like glycosyltransferase
MDIWFNLDIVSKVLLFVFVFYPIVGGIFWIIGGTYYHFRSPGQLPKFTEGMKEPFITIMVPCHNEEVVIQRTLYYLDTQICYENYEIIAISDGSTDKTNEFLRKHQRTSDHLRVIEVQKNKGKAHALTQAALHAKGEYLLCIDADSLFVSFFRATMISVLVVLVIIGFLGLFRIYSNIEYIKLRGQNIDLQSQIKNKEAIVETHFSKKLGTIEKRQSSKWITIREDQNIDTKEIEHLYQDSSL